MFVRLNCAIVDADAGNRQELCGFLTESGVSVTSMLPTIEQLGALLRQQPEPPPQLALVNLDPRAHEGLRAVGALIEQHPRTKFFVMSSLMDPQLLIDAIHLRVTEFIPLPMEPQRLRAGIERVARGEAAGSKRAKIINVIPTTGGCGATSIACNVAASLAAKGKACVVDLDLVCGGVAAAFDVTPRYTIADVLVSSDAAALDRNLLENALAVHERTGLAILARPEQPEASQRITRDGLRRLLGALAGLFEYVVIDSQISLDPLYAAAMRAADVNLLVMQLNVPAARNAERFVAAMRRSGVDPESIRIVVNRFDKRAADLSTDDVERTLGLRIAWTIPNDFKTAMAAINFGEPAVLRSPRADLSGSIAGLVQLLNGRTAARS